MLKAAAELLGTFVFLSVILASNGQAVPVAVGLLAAVYMVASVSGANLNPAVSVMQWLNNALSRDEMLWYVAAQVAGGVLALHVNKLLRGKTTSLVGDVLGDLRL